MWLNSVGSAFMMGLGSNVFAPKELRGKIWLRQHMWHEFCRFLWAQRRLNDSSSTSSSASKAAVHERLIDCKACSQATLQQEAQRSAPAPT